MNSIRYAIATLLLILVLVPARSSAQTQDGTIEASWNRASSAPAQRVLPPPSPAPQAVKPRPESRSDDRDRYPESAWEKERGTQSRPWPTLSANPTQNEYFQANTAVIDSLAHLYCLSANYLGSLRMRNQQALQSHEPGARQFDYDGRPAPSAQGRQSLQALHKELMLLLDRCLVGR